MLSLILSLQILFAAAFLLAKFLSLRIPASEKLKLQYLLIFFVLAIFLLQGLISIPHTSFAPLRKVELLANEVPGLRLPMPAPIGHSTQSKVPALSFQEMLPVGLKLALFVLLLFAALRVLKEGRELRTIYLRAYRIRKIGAVEILVDDHSHIPFTYSTLLRAVIILPASQLGDAPKLRMSIFHELQHHRQGDPLWAIFSQLLRPFAKWNPFLAQWIEEIHELQEFACDEALVGRNKVNSKAYARCLFQVAQTALYANSIPTCATGMMFSKGQPSLKRRIEMLLSNHQPPVKNWSAHISAKTWAKALVFVATLTTLAYTSKAVAESHTDREYTLTTTAELLKNVTGAEGFPLEVNAAVVNELNSYLGTHGKRKQLKEALARMNKDYQQTVDAALTTYQLPKALEAIPLIESRYQNLPQGGPMKSAGIWQFIPNTARDMGLKVGTEASTDASVDERLDAKKLSDAAGRLIRANQLLYNDLGLSILAFNWGNNQVNSMIAQIQSHNPWTLSQNFKQEKYLAQLVAAMIIIANPSVVND